MSNFLFGTQQQPSQKSGRLVRLRTGVRLAGAQLLLAGAGWLAFAPAAHADLWAYVDEFGITHFAAEALDERYKLFFKGERYDSTQPGLRPDTAAQGLTARTRMQSFFEVSPRYKSVRPHLQKAAERTGVEYELLKAVIAVESGFDPGAVSPKGAVGLMQLMPATAERFGVKDTTDPVQNIKGGVAYLDWLMGEFNGDPLMVLAAYNAGEGAVRKNSGVPPYAETRDYVPKVLAAWQVAQGLCQTPPELVSDPCVFKVLLAGG